jgi:uncharacterized protein YkwD
MTQRFFCLVALLGLTLASSVAMGDALVGRDSKARINARVIELVNDARSRGARCGRVRYRPAPPLRAVPELTEAAAKHARDMARRNYFEHRGRDGSEPKDRVLRAGYLPRLTGENIAFGPESAEEVVAGWMNSPGHCANIMDERFEHIGVALAAGRGRGRIYWVQEFGAPITRR